MRLFRPVYVRTFDKQSGPSVWRKEAKNVCIDWHHSGQNGKVLACQWWQLLSNNAKSKECALSNTKTSTLLMHSPSLTILGGEFICKVDTSDNLNWFKQTSVRRHCIREENKSSDSPRTLHQKASHLLKKARTLRDGSCLPSWSPLMLAIVCFAQLNKSYCFNWLERVTCIGTDSLIMAPRGIDIGPKV